MDGWNRTVLWSLAGAAIFTAAHSADELFSRWDYGATVTSGTFAAVGTAAILAGTLLAFAGTMAGRKWGFGLAAIAGAFAMYSGGTHLFQTAGMDAFRWTIVAFEVAFGLATVVAAGRELLVLRATKPTRPVGG